jgi:zinc protease
VFYVVAVVQPGHTPEEAEAALAAELDRLRTEPVSDDDLSKARNQLARDVVLGRATVHQKAEALGRAATIHGDAGQADAQFERAEAVTAADIQRVARRYFEPATRMAITVRPKPVAADAKKGAAR